MKKIILGLGTVVAVAAPIVAVVGCDNIKQQQTKDEAIIDIDLIMRYKLYSSDYRHAILSFEEWKDKGCPYE